MKRKFTLLIAALALLTMIVQPGRAWGQATVGTTMWAEDFSGYSANNVPDGAVTYSHTGTTVYDNGTVNYTCVAGGSATKIYNEQLAGGEKPELLVGKNTGSFTIANIPTGDATELTLTYKCNNNNNSVSSTTTGVTITEVTGKASTRTFTIETGGADAITLVISNTLGGNTRVDDFSVVVKTAGGGGDLEDSDLAIVDDPVVLNFNLYPTAIAQTVTYTTSSTGAVTVSESEYVTTSVSGYTITVTPVAVTPSAQTITVSQAADATYAAGSATFTVNVTNSAPTVTVTYHANGGEGENIVATPYQGSDYTVANNTFTKSGYAFTKWHTNAAGTGGTDYDPGDVIENISENIDLYAQWEESSEATATLTATNLELTGSYNDSDDTEITIDGITYIHTDLMKNSNNIQAKASSGTIKNTTAYPGDITSVVITHSGTARATTINGSADGTNWTQVATGNGSINANFSGHGYKYFQITRGSNAAYWTKIEITYSTGGGGSQQQSDLAITGAPVALSFDLYNNSDAQTVSYTTSSTGAITITPASPTTYFSYVHDAQNKTITVTPLAVTPSAQTVTISQAADDDYYAGTATFTVAVTNSDPTIPGTVNNPYTVAQAIAAIDANTGITGVYATGIVSNVDYYSTTNHYITYFISADGTTTSDQLEAFHGKGIDGADFTSIDDLQVGDIVIIYGNLTKYQQTYEFADGNYLISQIRIPSITPTPSPFTAPSYSAGTPNPTTANLTVTGSNLTADITATLNENSNFEIKDGDNWVSTITLEQSEGSFNGTIAIRLKAGLAVGQYNGTITLSTEGLDNNVVVNLTGSVSSALYDIVVTQPATGGTIAADKVTASEGETVTLTATPNAGYDFGSWSVFRDDMVTPITVENNQFIMPDCDVLVTATFTAKPTYAITCVATPDNTGLLVSTPESAYEGQTVTLEYTPETGYGLSSIVITKTEDGSATGITPTASGDDYTFTMPGYAVTATATFVSNVFEGSFMKVTSLDALEDGGYYILYGINDTYKGAMNSTLNEGKMGASEVTISENIINDPSRYIVWKLIASGDNWNLYNEITGKYCFISGDSSTGFVTGESSTYSYIVTVSNGNFTFKTTATNNRVIALYQTDFRTYKSGNTLNLYKYTNLTERTITFNGNGGTYNTETTYTQTVYDGVATALDANKFTKTNSAFAGWALTAEGDVTYADGETITVTGSDLNLYAKWSKSYTAMVDDEIVGGSVLVNGEEIVEAVEGATMTLTYSANGGYAFSAWNVYKENEPSTTVTVTNNTFTMPAYDVIVSATFVEAVTYSLVTNVNQIVSGKHYLIVGYKSTTAYAMGYDKGNNRNAVVVTVTENTITETTGVYEFVINSSGDNWTIYDKNTQSLNTNDTYGFLYAAGGSNNNYLKTRTANDDNKGVWSISIGTSPYVATITAQTSGIDQKNKMRFNNGNSPLFSCYDSGQSDIYLFVKDEDHNLEYYGDNTISSETLTSNSVVVGNGSVVTVTGTLSNDNPDMLVIEDGGQLVFSGTDVQATVKKRTVGEAKDDMHWYTIASPVANKAFTEVTNLVTASAYDLYRYNEGEYKWENYKSTEPVHSGFNTGDITSAFEAGRGYLYYNADGSELSFAGTLNNDEVSCNVTASHNGINLIGNPFTQNITLDNIEGTISAGGYVLNNANDWSADPNPTIQPCEGFIVEVADEQNITIQKTPSSKSRANRDYIALTVANSEYEDVTYALFSDGMGLSKINHRNADIPMVYIPQDGKNYAIATMDDNTQAFNLNFKAMTTGQYTLSFKAQGSYSYLHVIDRITGEDIDMLLDGEYTFIGSPRDNENRFIVKLSYNANIDELEAGDSFAYQYGNDIIVNGKGELQVFDVNGRMVMNTVINGKQTVNIPTTGLYIFRMVGESVKTQKIVVR